MSLVYITQGQHAVGREPEMIITTILGSCISICLWDPEARVGGMNHLLLPDARSGGNSGGDKARRLRFWPANGQAQMKLVKEEAPAPKPVPAPVGNDVDLF